MARGVGHIGILVRDLDQSARLYEELLGATLREVKVIAEQGVRVGMLSFQQGPDIELLEPLPDSRMAAALEKRGEGIQHISFDVEDIEKDLEALKGRGVSLIDESPRQGAEGPAFRGRQFAESQPQQQTFSTGRDEEQDQESQQRVDRQPGKGVPIAGYFGHIRSST